MHLLVKPHIGKLVFLILLLFPCLQTQAQVPVSNKPDVLKVKTSGATLQPEALPAIYPNSLNVNSVSSIESLAPINNINHLNEAGYQQVKRTTQFFDGLGRPLQVVNQQATPGGSPKDIVAPILFDDFGREVNKYLPYVQTTGGNSSDGKLKLSPFADQEIFYKTVYKDANNKLMYDGEQFFYSRTEYEQSPLHRIVKTMAAGNSWTGSNTGVGQEYLINTVEDSVRIWTISNNPLSYLNGDASTNIPSTPGVFKAGQLYKNVSKDEHGNATVQYINKDGQVILKKVQIGSVAGVSTP